MIKVKLQHWGLSDHDYLDTFENILHVRNEILNCIIFLVYSKAGAITMATDKYCRYLATGDGDGFVKVWNITEYCLNIIDRTPLTKQPREQV